MQAIDKIGTFLPSIEGAGRTGAAAGRAAGAGAAQPGEFADVLAQAIGQVDGSQHRAADLSRKFQTGDPAVSLEDAMIAMQKANLSFQAMVQVRNRLVSAYHDIMNMQV